MISGVVDLNLEATIWLDVHDVGGTPYPVEVLIDTGFTGELTLPQPRLPR